MTVGNALWPDQLSQAERALLMPGLPAEIEREPDVLVVGGGIVGCATAAACVQAGLGKVVLLEREKLGAGASGGAAGLLIPESHDGLDTPELVELGRLSLNRWRELDATWRGGVSLMPFSWHEHPQARVNPLRAITRLAAGLPSVATGVDVLGVETDDHVIRTVRTSHGEFRPEVVVFATGLPPRVDGLGPPIPSHEVKGHMLATRPTDLVPAPGVADSARLIDDHRILLGGTLDHGDTERVVRPEVTQAMLDELVRSWPAASELTIDYRWACFRPAHADLQPVIDRLPGHQNAWLTSGHYKTGILMAPATAHALAHWIKTGSAPAEITPFAVSRLLASTS